MTGSLPVASAATRSGNDNSTLSAVRNSIGTPRGVPDLSEVRLTMPTAAFAAKAGSGNKNRSARGSRASGS